MTTTTKPTSKSMNWLLYAYLTVLSWGAYGVILHYGRGQMPTGPETANAGLKAFLWVGIAYFFVAVIGPVLVLKARGSNFSFTGPGITWSFIAGVTGALGAFTLVLALGAAASPIIIGGGGFGVAAAAAVISILRLRAIRLRAPVKKGSRERPSL